MTSTLTAGASVSIKSYKKPIIKFRINALTKEAKNKEKKILSDYLWGGGFP